jgi:glycosyltransferase involved in cell wall biosynthesis
MHIVQALVSLNIGGSELVATELAEFLTANGHRVTVIATDGPLGQRVRNSGAALLDWPIGRKRLGTLGYIGHLARWLDEQQPDIVHAHSRLPAWICKLAIRRLSKRRRPKFVTSMHGHYSVSRYSAVMASGDKVIAVSDHILKYTLKNYPATDPERVVTIHGGIDRQVFPFGYRPDSAWHSKIATAFPEIAGKRILCLPGRLSRYKGHADFIELIAALTGDYPDLHGVIIGQAKTGSRYRDELEGLAQGYGVLDKVTFAGTQLNIRDWLASAEIVFSLCSDPPEAFGRTVPEALHLGIPVIGWNHGGVAEVLDHMFPSGAVEPDNRSALLARTQQLLEHGAKVIENESFGLTRSMERTEALYRSLCHSTA